MSTRDLRLDMWRGMALLMIFVDHIPGNGLAAVTLKSFGFSDAAELFVFVAGYSAMLAYGRRFFDGEGRGAILRILRRVGQLYLAHLALFALVAGIVALYAISLAGGDYDDPVAMLPFLSNPHAHLKHVLALRYVPKFLDILPLYIALMAMLPVMLLLARINSLLCLGASLLVYLAGQRWDLESWVPAGSPHWTFNPFAWQFLFALGVVTASEIRRIGQSLPRSPIAIGIAGAIVAGSLLLAAPWAAIPGLEGWTLVDPDFIYGFDKPNLSPVRIIHFLALAYLAAVTVPAGTAWLSGKYLRPIIRVGQHSLPIFCLGTVLSILGQLAFQSFGAGWPIQLGVDSVGFVTILVAGYVLASLRDRQAKSQKVIHLGGSGPVGGSGGRGRLGGGTALDGGSFMRGAVEPDRVRPVAR